MKRGEIHWADLVPRSGSEQTGHRPVIVISHDSASASQVRQGPTVVGIPAGNAGLPNASFAVCHQVATFDRSKLTKRIGTLPPEILQEVELGLKAAMDLD
jgi:mRNA interferase MazF